MFDGGNPLGAGVQIIPSMKASSKFDLNQVVQKLAHLPQHEHAYHKIAVILDLGTELPKITADGEQIECVLIALLARSRNAIIEARRPHGTITVRTRLKAGKIHLSITDDGMAEQCSNIPGASFTTTIEEDMNLTTCAEIVQDQEGKLYAWRPRHPAVTSITMDLPV